MSVDNKQYLHDLAGETAAKVAAVNEDLQDLDRTTRKTIAVLP